MVPEVAGLVGGGRQGLARMVAVQIYARGRAGWLRMLGRCRPQQSTAAAFDGVPRPVVRLVRAVGVGEDSGEQRMSLAVGH
jgi:hypothetical protein